MTDLFADRAAKLLRMLTSPVDSEALSAARALVRGCDIHALADVVERHFRSSPAQPELELELEPDPKKPWQAFAAELLRHPQILGMRGNRLDRVLFDRELDFLTNMRKSRIAPSGGQEKWMADIQHRIQRRRAA